MTTIPKIDEIKQQIKDLPLEEAVAVLREAQQGRDASEQAILEAEAGKLLWRLGHRAEALSAYSASASMDPKGPGAVLMDHSNSIMDFFFADLLNP